MSQDNYHYIQTESNLWTVGTGDPGTLLEVTEFGYRYSNGKNFNGESDHNSSEKAAARVNFLNGGGDPDDAALQARIAELEAALALMDKEFYPCENCDETGLEPQTENACRICGGYGFNPGGDIRDARVQAQHFIKNTEATS